MKARLSALVLTALLAAAGSARAQQDALITPNYKDADLGQVIEAVSQVTGKNFIVDPRVKAQVTMLSSTPMNAAAFYEAFLAILQVHGFVAVPSGKVIKILPDANARQLPANDLPDSVSSTSDEIVTQVIQVRAVSAAQLVPILRPLIPQYGHLAAYPASNMLIISDRASNVNRMVRIIQRIDQAGDSDVDVIRLEHASAAEVVRVVNALTQAGGAGAEGGGGGGARLVADERTNSVLLGGEATQRLRMKTLIAHLDTPLESGGDTQVRYLRYADAEKIAAKLKEQLQGTAAGPAGQQSAQTQQERSTTIWADPQMNALVVTAPPKVMRSLMSVVDRLDVRRAQVLVEALLVELSIDKAADLGVNWLVDGSNDNFLVGLYNQAVNGVGIGDIAKAVAGVVTPATTSSSTNTSGIANVTVPGGLTLVGGRKQDTGTNFAAMLRAQMGDGNTNVISMPSVITMDNEEAQIKVAQEVPFVTGQYTNTGAATGSVNPFQTIQRQEVGIILKITPQITDDGTILLKIAQEASTLASSSQGAVDLITNKRTINTRVLVDDGGMLVLGGLIQDTMGNSEQRVTGLGSIPVLGALFRVRSTTKVKTNLMVFIRPRVLRDAAHAAFETNSKYNYLRDLQRGLNGGKVPLMYGEKQPALPELEGPSAEIPGRAAQPPGPNTGTPAVAPPAAPSPPEPQAPSGQQPVAAPPPTTPPANGK